MRAPILAKIKCSRCGAEFTPSTCKCEILCQQCLASPYRRFPISENTGWK